MEEAREYDKILEIKQAIEQEKGNQDTLNKKIRQLKELGRGQGETLKEISGSTHQFDNIMALTEK